MAGEEIISHYLLKDIAVCPLETFAVTFRNHTIKTRVPAEYKAQYIVSGITKTLTRRYKQDDRWKGIAGDVENIPICRT